MDNLLIVDDDYMVVDGIRAAMETLDLGIADIFVATTVSQAKEILKKHPVDIIICDIEMPQGSGLDLLEWAQHLKIKLNALVLTGHANFEYAKKALQLGCVDYILKPVSYEELAESIRKITLRDNDKGVQKSKYNYLVKNYKSFSVKKFWKDVLNEKIPANMQQILKASEEAELPLTIDLKTLPILVKLHEEHIGTARAIEHIQQVSEIFLSALPRASVAQILIISEESFLALLFFDEPPEEQELEKAGEAIIRTCLNDLKLEVSCYIGKPVHIDKLASMFRDLIILAESNHAQLSKVFFKENIPSCSDYKPPELSSWAMLLKHGEKGAIIREVSRYLDARRKNGCVNRDFLRRFNMDLVQMLCLYLEEQGIHANYIVNDEMSQDLFAKATAGIEDTIDWVDHIIDKVLDYIKETKKSSPVEKAKRYIEDHYTEELHRKDIESYTFMNADYLNRIFKKETGNSLMDYMIQLRLNTAKELLVKTSLTIGEISEKVGYNGISNFSTMFKKYTGVSPVEYRNTYNSL